MPSPCLGKGNTRHSQNPVKLGFIYRVVEKEFTRVFITDPTFKFLADYGLYLYALLFLLSKDKLRLKHVMYSIFMSIDGMSSAGKLLHIHPQPTRSPVKRKVSDEVNYL